MAGRGELLDRQWEVIAPYLPKNTFIRRKRERCKRGRPWVDHRKVINGILWVMRTGAPWRDMPER